MNSEAVMRYRRQLYNDKGTHPEDTIVKIHSPNMWAAKYIKQILTDLKVKNTNNTVIEGDFNTTISIMDKSPR